MKDMPEEKSYTLELYVNGSKIFIKSPVDKDVFMNNVYDKSSRNIDTGWYDFEDAEDGEMWSIRIRDINAARKVSKFKQLKS